MRIKIQYASMAALCITQNMEFLLRVAFPVMKSTCEYWFGCLVEDKNGKLIAPDEWSPEHGLWEDGVAYAQQLVWQLFSETLHAVEELQQGHQVVDKEFAQELAQKFIQLDNGISIGLWGQIREWKKDRQCLDTLNNQHRHLSQLIALYPGNQIFSNIQYADAARRTLLSRGDFGTGWSRAWKIACWARLLDGDHVYRLLKSALSLSTTTVISMENDKGGVYENLLDSHPPFQIDGNFGAVAGMAEMLLQSHQECIHLLPALLSVWQSGYVDGIRAIGNFTFCMEWSEGLLRKCEIRSGSGKECRVRSDKVQILGVKDSLGKKISVINLGNGCYKFMTEAGGKYRLVLRR